MLESPPNKGRFKLTNGYAIDFNNIARLMDYICPDNRTRFLQAELTEALGLSDAHSEAIFRFAESMGLTQPKTSTPTMFGRLVTKEDKFFDDIGTLWFCHYVAASNPQNIVWNCFANKVIPVLQQFTIAQFSEALEGYRPNFSAIFFNKFVIKEPKYLVKAYIDENFAKLMLLRQENDVYSLSYRETIPPLVLLACIAHFRDALRPGDTSLSVSDLLNAPNSPGVVCQIPEDRLRSALEELKTQPGISLESRADLDQIRLTDNTQNYQWMERYYERRG